jgi:hypothetical protein
MAQKRREPMANKKKPTNKEMVREINHLGQRLMMTEQVLTNYVKVFDLYLNYRKDDKKFQKYIKTMSEKNLKAKEKKKDGK